MAFACLWSTTGKILMNMTGRKRIEKRRGPNVAVVVNTRNKNINIFFSLLRDGHVLF